MALLELTLTYIHGGTAATGLTCQGFWAAKRQIKAGLQAQPQPQGLPSTASFPSCKTQVWRAPTSLEK